MSFDMSSLFARLPRSNPDRQINQWIWIGAGTALMLGSIWTIRDKQKWAAFGTGGTKPTWFGYLRNNVVLRTVLALSFDDLRDHRTLDANAGPSYLKGKLPERQHPRPQSHGYTLPQRSKPGPIEPIAKERLWSLTQKYVTEHPDVLIRDLSNSEGRTTMAIYAKDGISGRPASAFHKLLGNEIVHIHPEENSLHVWLSEADCAEVVRKGWGEKFTGYPTGLSPPGFAFVYAPQDIQELEIVEQIVEAGIQHVTGTKL